MRSVPGRGRATAALVAILGLCLGGAAVIGTTGVAQGATDSCDTPYPIGKLHKGDRVTGLTVTSGTRPTGFTGSYLGDLRDGIAPGIDMLMFKLSSAEIDEVGGIWEGMSGSPVYAGNGGLIGAVAYGLSNGASPIVGVTPYAEMNSTMPTAARVRIDPQTARRLGRVAGVPAARIARGAHMLEIPIGVSGVSGHRLARLAGRDKAPRHRWSPRSTWLTRDVHTAGRAGGAEDPSAEDIVAGGNLAATMSYGDVTMAGVGTVTSICKNRVVGFGHPMNFLGETTYGLAGADALFVQPDSLGVPFKVANIGTPVGTIDQDRQTGLTGSLGPMPPTTSVTSQISFGARERTGTTKVQTPTADVLASVTNYQLSANGDRVLDAWTGGSESQQWKIAGRGPDGRPFTIDAGNRYISSSDITFDSSWDLPDLVYLLGNVPGVRLTSISSSAVAGKDTRTYRISGVQQWRGHRWRTVQRGAPVKARAGKAARLRVQLTGGASVPLTLRLPGQARHLHGQLWLSSAMPFPFEMSQPRTLDGVLGLVRDLVRNDQAAAEVNLFGRTGRTVSVQTTSGVADRVIVGQLRVPVRVR